MGTTNTGKFLEELIRTARELMESNGGDADKAACDALDEAHANLSQARFFERVDALGGDLAIRRMIAEKLAEPAESEAIQDMLRRINQYLLGPQNKAMTVTFQSGTHTVRVDGNLAYTGSEADTLTFLDNYWLKSYDPTHLWVEGRPNYALRAEG